MNRQTRSPVSTESASLSIDRTSSYESDRGQPAPEGLDRARSEDERDSLDAGLPEEVIADRAQGDVGGGFPGTRRSRR